MQQTMTVAEAQRQVADYAMWAELALREHEAPEATVPTVATVRSYLQAWKPGDLPDLVDVIWSEIDEIVATAAGRDVAKLIAELGAIGG